MRILIYSNNFIPLDRGGMEKFLYSLVQLLKKNHKVVLVLPNKNNISIKGIKIYRIPKFLIELKNTPISFRLIFVESIKFCANLISYFCSVPWIIIRNRIDLINVFQPSPYSTFIVIISKLFRKKSILNLRGLEGDRSMIEQLLMDTSILFSSHILCNSKDLYERYKKTSMLPKSILNSKNSYFIPNGINTYYWKPSKKQVTEKKYDIVFVGNLTNRSHIINKGILYLYQALKTIKLQFKSSLKVLVIGYFDKKLLNEMISKDIEKYFEFKGFIQSKEELKETIQSSKIYVLTSVSEGMPNSLMEAMALEMPCIASSVGGVPDLIEHNKDGLIFETKNSFQLAKLILMLLSDKALQKELGINARKKLISKFEWNQIIKKFENIYIKLLKL